MLKHLAIISLSIFAAIGCAAQDANHFTLWSRLRVIKTFSPKWEAEIDLQYRRQDNDNLNIAALPLASSARLWVYHRPAPKLTIGFSPFAWFHNYALVSAPGDKLKDWNEYRMYLYGEYRVSVAKKLILFSRIGAEPMLQQRIWGNRSFIRLRWREQINLQLRAGTQLFAGTELFLNSFSSEKISFYNQVRGFAGIQYHISKHFIVTGGYMFQHIMLPNKNYQRSHDLLAGAIIHL